MADHLVRQGKIDEAGTILTRELSARETGGVGQASDPVAQELRLRRGWARFLGGRLDEALSDYSRIPDDGPPGPTVLARMSLILTARGDAPNGLVMAAAAIDRNRENPWGYCARGWVFLTRRGPGDLERALADFERALRAEPDPFIAFSLRQAQARPTEGAPEFPGRIPEALLAPFQSRSKSFVTLKP